MCKGRSLEILLNNYQNTTKGFEFSDANFKIKAQSKIAKGDK